jgi:hypothetical protein
MGDKSNSPVWARVEQFFTAAMKHVEGVVNKHEKPANDETDGWEPHAFEQKWSTVLFFTFCGASIGKNEKEQWKNLVSPVLFPVPFLTWYSKVTNADLTCLRDKSSPRLTLNGVEFVISLLYDAGIEDEPDKQQCFSVVCLPFSFTHALFESFLYFGRRGIARFVSCAFHYGLNNGPLGGTMRDLFNIKKKKVLLFPFRDFGGDDLYLGILLLHHATDGVVSECVENRLPTLKVVRYGKPNLFTPVTNVDASYVSVLRDFIDMAFAQNFAFKRKSVGYNLHTEEAYYNEMSSRESLSAVVLQRKMSKKNACQTMYLMDDILYFFFREQSLSPTVMTEFCSEWELNQATPKSISIANGIVRLIDSMVIRYFEALCVKIFPIFDEFMLWIKNGNDIDTRKSTRAVVDLPMIQPYIRRGKEFVKYLYVNDLIQDVDPMSLGRFMHDLTVFLLREANDQRLSDTTKRENYYLEHMECELCKNWQIPRLHETNYCVSFALPSAQDDYKKRLCITHDDAVSELASMWDEYTGKQMFGDEQSYNGVAHYLKERHPKTYSDIFDHLEDAIVQECRWETPTMLELVHLLMHWYHPLPTTAVAFTNERLLDAFLEEKTHFTIPENFDQVVCIACEDSHFAVLDVHVRSRQIFVYDGCDQSILDAKCPDYLKKAASGAFQSTINKWKSYCRKLLQVLSILKTPKVGKTKPVTLKVTTTTSHVEKRPLQHTFPLSAKDNWLVMPAHLVLDEDSPKLIYQIDNFSCGPIALLHFMMVLDMPMPDGWESVYSNFSSLVMSLPWEEMIGGWLSKCLEPRLVHKEHRERYDIILDETSDSNDGANKDKNDGGGAEQDQEPPNGDEDQAAGDSNEAPLPDNDNNFRALQELADDMDLPEEAGEPKSKRFVNLKQFRRDLRIVTSQLKLKMRPGSNPEYWNVKTQRDKQMERVQIPKDDRNPILEVSGLPAYIKPVFVSDFFPTISMVRFLTSVGVWEIRLPSFGKDTEIWHVRESFLQFIFREEFFNKVAASRGDDWCQVIYDDYQLDRIALLEQYLREARSNVNMDLTPSERDERRKVVDLASDYFYTESVESVIQLKHVIPHRVAAVKDVIITSLREYQTQGLHVVGSRVPFICSQAPHWYVSIWRRGVAVVHRRVLRTRVMTEFPIVTIQKAITDPYHWVTTENDKSQTLVRWNVSNHANLPDTVVDVENQISHVMFRTYHTAVETLLKKDCKLGRRYGTQNRGWYLGSTESDPDKFELLDYEWVQENFDSRFYKLLLTKGWCDRWITLPAGSSREKLGARRTRLTSKKSNTGIANGKADETLVEYLERDYPCLPNAEIKDGWPLVHYRQGPKDQTCLFMSMASALHYLGHMWKRTEFIQIASNIKNFANREAKGNWTTIDRVESLKKIMGGSYVNYKTKKQVTVGCPELLTNIGYFNEKNVFDPLTNQKMLPTLAICESVDGSRDHAVTFVGSWVFDSNEQRAFPISRLSLNRCVPFGFKRVVLAFRFGKNIKMPPVPLNSRKRKGGTAGFDDSKGGTAGLDDSAQRDPKQQRR